MRFEEKLIIDKKGYKEKFVNMLDALNSDKVQLNLFIKNPNLFLITHGIVTPGNNFPIGVANRLLFLALSSPKLNTWLHDYETKLIEKYGKTIDLTKVNKVRIYRDFITAFLESMDEELLRALIEAPGPNSSQTGIDLESDVSVQFRQGRAIVNTDVIAFTDSLVIVEVFAFLVHVTTVTGVTSDKIGSLEGFEDLGDRREFTLLFDVIARRLNEEAVRYRKRAEAFSDLNVKTFD